MPGTGIFFVPATPGAGTGAGDAMSPAQLIFSNLLLRNHHLEPLSFWNMDYKLFRETPAASMSGDSGLVSGPGATSNLSLLQVLTLSWQKGDAYAAISRPVENANGDPSGQQQPGMSQANGTTAPSAPSASASSMHVDMIQLPAGSAGSDELVSLLAARFAPLWTRRTAWAVQNGTAFRVDETFTLRFGEVREGRMGGQPVLRGTVAMLSIDKLPPRLEKESEDSDSDVPLAEEHEARNMDETHLLNKFWGNLEIPNSRAYVAKHDKARGAEMAIVRLWLEALRPRN